MFSVASTLTIHWSKVPTSSLVITHQAKPSRSKDFASTTITATTTYMCILVSPLRDGVPHVVQWCSHLWSFFIISLTGHGKPNQRWYRTPNGEMKTRHDDKCLTLDNFPLRNLWMAECNGGDNQKFPDGFMPVYGAIRGLQGRCLGMNSAKEELYVTSCNSEPNQRFSFDELTETVKIQGAMDLCLNFDSDSNRVGFDDCEQTFSCRLGFSCTLVTPSHHAPPLRMHFSCRRQWTNAAMV